MSRLTKTNWKNLDPWETCDQGMYCTRNCHEDGGCANGCPVPKNYRRLAEYEDAGMTPEIAIRSREFKRERDYWKKEALKWASELGEQKLERGKNEGN